MYWDVIAITAMGIFGRFAASSKSTNKQDAAGAIRIYLLGNVITLFTQTRNFIAQGASTDSQSLGRVFPAAALIAQGIHNNFVLALLKIVT